MKHTVSLAVSAALVVLAVLILPAEQASTLVHSGSSLPSTCTAGGAQNSIYIKTGTSPGLYWCSSTDTWTGPIGGGDVTAAAVLADNTLVRGDGGAKGVQDSGIAVDDSDHVTGLASITIPNTGLHVLDTDASHDLILAPGTNLTADHTLSLNMPDEDVPLDLDVWTDIAYSAGNFTGSGSMTWTVDMADQITLAYLQIGKTVILTVSVQLTTVGGTASNFLQFTMPFTASRSQRGPLQIVNGGLGAAGVWITSPSSTTLLFAPAVGGNWSLGTNNASVYGTIVIEIE